MGTCDALLCELILSSCYGLFADPKESAFMELTLSGEQPLIGSTIREFFISFFLWILDFCVAYIDTVSIKLIIAHYGGWLSKLTV